MHVQNGQFIHCKLGQCFYFHKLLQRTERRVPQQKRNILPSTGRKDTFSPANAILFHSLTRSIRLFVCILLFPVLFTVSPSQTYEISHRYILSIFWEENALTLSAIQFSLSLLDRHRFLAVSFCILLLYAQFGASNNVNQNALFDLIDLKSTTVLSGTLATKTLVSVFVSLAFCSQLLTHLFTSLNSRSFSFIYLTFILCILATYQNITYWIALFLCCFPRTI